MLDNLGIFDMEHVKQKFFPVRNAPGLEFFQIIFGLNINLGIGDSTVFWIEI